MFDLIEVLKSFRLIVGVCAKKMSFSNKQMFSLSGIPSSMLFLVSFQLAQGGSARDCDLFVE